MNDPNQLDWLSLERLYEEGCELTRRGKKEEAIRRFEQILGITTEFRDVAEVKDDWYLVTPVTWLTKHQKRFQK